MNKDFSEKKLLQMDLEKQVRVLYELASFIEQNQSEFNSSHFEKLKRYHTYLANHEHERIQKLNKEFLKVKGLDYQFQIYLMNLERLLGQSKKEYDFLIQTGDQNKTQKNQRQIICLLDSVRSAHNVGAFFRNAECFGIEKILLCGLSPKADHPQVIKTAMGTEKIIPWEYHRYTEELITKLKDDGYEIWSIETAKESQCINNLSNIPEKLVLIFGHEQFGVSLELLEASDKYISIKLHGQKNSLNVAVSQAIVLNQLIN